jgi:hypothetical protein
VGGDFHLKRLEGIPKRKFQVGGERNVTPDHRYKLSISTSIFHRLSSDDTIFHQHKTFIYFLRDKKRNLFENILVTTEVESAIISSLIFVDKLFSL